MEDAEEIMARLNPHALHAWEDGDEIFIEDWLDPDGRWYRLEYACDPDGSNARASVLFNPWVYNPYSYEDSHITDDGKLCVGPGQDGDHTPFDLDFVVERARFWCTGFSFLMEHGYAETCALIPEWGEG